MKRCSYLIVLTLCLVGISIPQSKNNQRSVQNTNVNWAQRALQGYNMRVWISNQMTMGLQAWDASSGDQIPVEPHFGMEYPANSGVEHLFALAPRIGGLVNGVRLVDKGYNGLSGSKEFVPTRPPRGRIFQTSALDNWGIPNKRYCDDDGDGLIDEDDLDGTDNDGDWNPSADDVGADGLADPFELSCDGKPYGTETNPDPAGDNYDPDARDLCHPNPDGSYPFKNNRDQWTEKNGIPDHGEPHVDEDYAAISDNDLYCSATDTFSRPVIAGHVPMGLMCIQKSYAWNNKYYEAILPFDYYFVNIGRDTIKDVFVGFYADMDIGPTNVPQYFIHNYAAYNYTIKTAYIHNPIDRGSTPLGITLLGATKSLDSLFYVFRWDYWPVTRSDECELYDSCAYTWMDGSAFPGQPIMPDQTEVSDAKFILSFGPFDDMIPGDTLKISMALVSGYGVDEGVNTLVENARKAIKLYNSGYISPVTPVSPELDVTIKPKKAELKWYPSRGAVANSILPSDTWDDSNKLAESYPDDHWRRINPSCGGMTGECTSHRCDENGKLPGGRTFAGFRLYRSEDVNSEPLEQSFVLMREYLLPDTATEWSLTHMDTTFIDSNLVYGKRYWYAVTSIGLPDITLLKIPQPYGSIRYDTLYSEYSESSLRENWVKVDMSFLPSEKSGEVLVVPNPYRTDQNYSYESGGWEGHEWFWNENMRLVKFIHLPKGEWTLRIFTLVGEKVTVIKNTIANGYEEGGRWIEGYRDDRGEITYKLVNESGRALASGVYLFIVDSDLGQQTGKFVVIR